MIADELGRLFGKQFILDNIGKSIAILRARNHEFLVENKGRNTGNEPVLPFRFHSPNFFSVQARAE